MCHSSCHSVFLAQVIGCFVFFVSLAMLVHHHRYKKTSHEFLANPLFVELSGVLYLLFGLVIVVSHNIWVGHWPVVVTIIGWIFLLQGLGRIFFPEAFVKMMKDLTAKSGYALVTWAWLIVGIYLLWVSYLRMTSGCMNG